MGHAGVGSSNYLICRAFTHAAGIEVTLVSYRGAAPALNDLIGGQIDGVCDSAASVTGTIQSGRIRGLAISSPTRLGTLPDVPTSAEAGLPELPAAGLERPVRSQSHAGADRCEAQRRPACRRRQRGPAQAHGRSRSHSRRRRGPTSQYVAALIPVEIERISRPARGRSEPCVQSPEGVRSTRSSTEAPARPAALLARCRARQRPTSARASAGRTALAQTAAA